MDHIPNKGDTIENTNHFCGFLLQLRSEGGRKDHFRPEFNTKILAECQIGDDICIYRKTQRNAAIGKADLSMGSIRAVEEIGLWIFR